MKKLLLVFFVAILFSCQKDETEDIQPEPELKLDYSTVVSKLTTNLNTLISFTNAYDFKDCSKYILNEYIPTQTDVSYKMLDNEDYTSKCSAFNCKESVDSTPSKGKVTIEGSFKVVIYMKKVEKESYLGKFKAKFVASNNFESTSSWKLSEFSQTFSNN